MDSEWIWYKLHDEEFHTKEKGGLQIIDNIYKAKIILPVEASPPYLSLALSVSVTSADASSFAEGETKKKHLTISSILLQTLSKLTAYNRCIMIFRVKC